MSLPPTKRTSPSETLRLWKAATPIQNARTKFGPKELAEKFTKTKNVTFLGEMLKHGASQIGQPMAGTEVLRKAMEAAQPANQEKWDAFHALNKFFLDEFRSGNLRCFAFERPRTLTSCPVEITPEYWTGYPDWEKGEYSCNGLHFIELRVLENTHTEQPSYEIKQLTKGRPSISPFVVSAFEALQVAGKIDTNSSAKSHYPMIRIWIAANCPEASIQSSNLSDEGIRSHFSPLFKELKRNSKQ